MGWRPVGLVAVGRVGGREKAGGGAEISRTPFVIVPVFLDRRLAVDRSNRPCIVNVDTMPADSQVAKWGNSLAVRIPRTIAKEARLAEGDPLSLDVDADGNIVVRSARRKYALSQLVSGITPRNRHDETDWGKAVGKGILVSAFEPESVQPKGWTCTGVSNHEPRGGLPL